MQFYRSEYNCSRTQIGSVDTNVLIKTMSNLLKCIDYIEELHILGGEPFLNVDLNRMLNWLIGIKRIKNITIVTNGTIVPSQEIMEILQDKRCEVFISNYGNVSSRIVKISLLCAEMKIRYKVLNNSH